MRHLMSAGYITSRVSLLANVRSTGKHEPQIWCYMVKTVFRIASKRDVTTVFVVDIDNSPMAMHMLVDLIYLFRIIVLMAQRVFVPLLRKSLMGSRAQFDGKAQCMS